eukprot:Nk52_evm67s352 gene=Nk52_evmTU67s352
MQKTTNSTDVTMLVLGLCVAAALRIWLFNVGLHPLVAERIEVSTPLTSLKALQEGEFLYSEGLDPYSSDVVHQPALVIYALHKFKEMVGAEKELPFSITPLMCLFIVVDILTALTLRKVVDMAHKSEVKYYEKYPTKDIPQNLILKYSPGLQNAAALLFLLNPFSVIICCAMSLHTVYNLVVFLALFFALANSAFLSTFFLGLAAYLQLYPVILVFPIAGLIHRNQHNTTTSARSRSFILLRCICFTSLWFGLLCIFSYAVSHSLACITSVYGFIILIPDLTPNVGLFWYYFIEIFEQFRLFFLYVFQFNFMIYIPLLSFRLRDYPMALAICLLMLISILKTYPSIGDSVTYIALLPCLAHLFQYMKNMYLVANVFIYCSFLAPVFWYQWIYAGSGNANFYYAITLVYAAAQLLMLVDTLQSLLRYKYDRVNGIFANQNVQISLS